MVPYYGGNFVPTEASSVAVDVRGEPIAGSGGPGLTQLVIAAMRGNTAYPTALWPLPPGGRAPYRAVLVFRPPMATSNAALCAEPLVLEALPVPQPPAPRTPFSASLCRGDGLLSAVFGSIDTSAPGTPAFAAAIAAITRSLFPAFNPELEPRSGFGFFF
jgi:hypothetical protein